MGFEPTEFLMYRIVLGEMYDISILPLFPSNNFFKWFSPLLQSDAHPPSEPPSHFFSISNMSKTIYSKKSLQIYKQFFKFPNIFQYFFSHEKRNRTFTLSFKKNEYFTIKLSHGVILLTFMTSMQRRGLEPLHPVFTTGALPTELTDAPSLQEDINLKTFREFYIAHPNVSDP